MKKRVLVYPCGTEIGLEIFRALRYAKGYELVGGTSNYDHGNFVYNELIEDLPFINDCSDEKMILEFEEAISTHNIDFIYPAMDGVVYQFAKHRKLFKEVIIAPDEYTAGLCRSKKETYETFQSIIEVPKVYNSIKEANQFPIFVKPDRGQGSAGAFLINKKESLKKVDFDKNVVTEYLPGKEYTVDCFTNQDGKLIYAKGRGRRRIKNGISVNSVFVEDDRFNSIAEKINATLNQKGGWFFQLKEDANGELKLLEVAARIAGTSAISRCIGANLPLMTMDIFNNIQIDDMTLNAYSVELDRALENKYKVDMNYSTVYVDYDDTLVQDGIINTLVIRFLYQCLNNKKRLVLLSKHEGNLRQELKQNRISELFDDIIHLSDGEKSSFICDKNAIFIDDSYGERKRVVKDKKICVFDTNMLECLLND